MSHVLLPVVVELINRGAVRHFYCRLAAVSVIAQAKEDYGCGQIGISDDLGEFNSLQCTDMVHLARNEADPIIITTYSLGRFIVVGYRDYFIDVFKWLESFAKKAGHSWTMIYNKSFHKSWNFAFGIIVLLT
ncbi:MAG: hypothetical protein HYV68_00705 [Candidatus Taylorbacteria bacterium]|nr:hypothetical protein [Candidatus Taylorbacteria bacterium]